nr:hypothetical protein [Mycolicibacterium komanii]CRL70041.1 5-methylcytosine-specific restriction enzyme subunit McrC [Mycolicibacterium komanii]
MAEPAIDVRTLRLIESTDKRLALTPAEAAGLRRIGKVLASQKRWWGDDPEETDESPARAVVRCTGLSDGEYSVRVSDAIGVIGLGQTQLIVDPKIPLPHLLYLFAESDQLPRHLLERSRLGIDPNFFLVIAAWFVETCETLLRHGLVTDYTRITNDITCARGRIHTIATARSVLVGRPTIRCEYEVRGDDTSLNRVVKAAALRLLGFPGLPDDLRARCRRIQHRLSDVGDLRHDDFRARPDALTRSYTDVHPLAMLILNAGGVSMHEGAANMWTFLCRTPDAVEAGVRNTLSTRLSSTCPITKRGLQLAGDQKRTLYPDLLFGNTAAVGDVKYKWASDGLIRRSDLNQVTTFATGYGVSKAAVIAFGPKEIGEHVRIGPVEVNGFNWNTESVPGKAADDLAHHVAAWLSGDDFPRISDSLK